MSHRRSFTVRCDNPHFSQGAKRSRNGVNAGEAISVVVGYKNPYARHWTPLCMELTVNGKTDPLVQAGREEGEGSRYVKMVGLINLERYSWTTSCRWSGGGI